MVKSSKTRARRKYKVGRVIVSSRVRLARNVKNQPFPDWAKPNALSDLTSSLVHDCAAAGKKVSRRLLPLVLNSDSIVEFEALRDSGLASQVLLDRGEGAAILFESASRMSPSEQFSVMINEEDHLRIQAIVDGYSLDDAWRSVDAFDSALGSIVEYAFSNRLGFLTACPSNVGTGLRASVEVYLPALLLLNEFDAVQRAVTQLKFNFRGLAGEGSSLNSGMVQISTGGTLGLSEEQALASLKHIVDEVVRLEENARSYILAYRPYYLFDYISRAIAILSGAYLICYDEAISCLQALHLGVELGLAKGITLKTLEPVIASLGNGSIKMMMAREKVSAEDFSLRQVPFDSAPNRFNEEFDAVDAFRGRLAQRLVRNVYFNPNDYL